MEYNNFCKSEQVYMQTNLPASISMAIYHYGDDKIKDINLYGDFNDGTSGFIFTNDYFYYCFVVKEVITLKDVEKIVLNVKRDQLVYLSLITNYKTYVFDNTYFVLDLFAQYLSDFLDLEVLYDGDVFDQIYHYSYAVLNDIKDDLYEDTLLNDTQNQMIIDYLDNLHTAISFDEQSFQLEMGLFIDKMVSLIDELEIDSEQIDELYQIHDLLKKEEEKMFDKVNDLYENNKDSIKSMTGIDIDSIKDKSPEELNQMLDDLCSRFNISKDQLNSLASKFSKN